MPLPKGRIISKQEYLTAIDNIRLAMSQLEPDGKNCVICGDGDHQAWECHHNPVYSMQFLDSWRCFHCNAVFFNEDDARKHFGSEHEETVPSLLAWAESRKKDEVENRPDKNIYKRMLTRVWNQVIKRLGGVP